MHQLLLQSDSLPASLAIEVQMNGLAYSVRNENVSEKYILYARDVHACLQTSIFQLGMESPRDGSVRIAATPGSVLTHAWVRGRGIRSCMAWPTNFDGRPTVRETLAHAYKVITAPGCAGSV